MTMLPMTLSAFAFGLGLALALTPLVRRLAVRFGAVDWPDGGRKRHEKPTPLWGGLAAYAAFALTVWLLRDGLLGGFLTAKQLSGILGGGFLLVLGGLLDDRFDLKPRHQLFFTASAALLVVASGIGTDVITNPLGGVLRLDRWQWTFFERNGLPYRLVLPADLFTFSWLMVMMYTTKFLDGLDGLVSGLGVIGAVVLALYSLTPEAGQPELARLAMVAAGAFGGFLFYNARPASIFLGEGGATFCGFLLGVMAILSGGKIGTTLMVLAVPLMDLVWTMVRRGAAGKPLTKGDDGHLHYRLIAFGLTPGQAVGVFWLFAAAFGFTGLFLDGRDKLIALAILGILFVIGALRLRRKDSTP